MIEIVIGENQAGQRFDKYLGKLLSNAPSSFYYKMLRKKNITLNGKKAEGKEKLAIGDCVQLFLAKETFEKFSGSQPPVNGASKENNSSGNTMADLKLPKELAIVYEDEQILLWNKPVNMLSQKAKDTDISLNDYFLSYLVSSGQLKQEDFNTFKPSICNRLDRNTSGLVICGKTLPGLQKMNELLKTRELKKYYICAIKGELKEAVSLEGYLKKDAASNKVQLSTKKTEDSAYIQTEIKPLSTFVLAAKTQKAGNEGNKGNELKQLCTLAEVHLITGKTHQIRAHLASIGHPILCDYKYGDRKLNDSIKASFKVSEQLLHAYRLVFPKMEEPFINISERTFQTEFPERFRKLGIDL